MGESEMLGLFKHIGVEPFPLSDGNTRVQLQFKRHYRWTDQTRTMRIRERIDVWRPSRPAGFRTLNKLACQGECSICESGALECGMGHLGSRSKQCMMF